MEPHSFSHKVAMQAISRGPQRTLATLKFHILEKRANRKYVSIIEKIDPYTKLSHIKISFNLMIESLLFSLQEIPGAPANSPVRDDAPTAPPADSPADGGDAAAAAQALNVVSVDVHAAEDDGLELDQIQVVDERQVDGAGANQEAVPEAAGDGGATPRRSGRKTKKIVRFSPSSFVGTRRKSKGD